MNKYIYHKVCTLTKFKIIVYLPCLSFINTLDKMPSFSDFYPDLACEKYCTYYTNPAPPPRLPFCLVCLNLAKMSCFLPKLRIILGSQDTDRCVLFFLLFMSLVITNRWRQRTCKICAFLSPIFDLH